MRFAFALAAAACGRVGFDPIGADAPDAGTAGATMTAACDYRGATCTIYENDFLPGATGGYEQFSCDDNRLALQFSGQGANTIAVNVNASFDTVVHVLRGSDCNAAQVRCVDVPGTNERVTLDGSLGDPLVVLVDGGCGYVSIGWAMGPI